MLLSPSEKEILFHLLSQFENAKPAVMNAVFPYLRSASLLEQQKISQSYCLGYLRKRTLL